MNRVTGLTSCFVVAGALIAGCHNEDTSSKSEKMSMPTTMPAMNRPGTTAGPAAEPAMKDADMTHMLMADVPMYGEMPMGPEAKPMMMLKKDTKVMVMTPRGTYTQITTVGGQKGYVTTASLQPIGK